LLKAQGDVIMREDHEVQKKGAGVVVGSAALSFACWVLGAGVVLAGAVLVLVHHHLIISSSFHHHSSKNHTQP